MNILKYLFPVPKPDSRRVITFSNTEDYISFRWDNGLYVRVRACVRACARMCVRVVKPPSYRHHTFKKMNGKEVELKEVGPRFEMKCESST